MNAAITSMMAIRRTNTDWWGAIRRPGSAIGAADEDVAGAANRADPHRLARIVAELLAHATDQDVDRAVERLPVHAAGLVHDPVATEDPTAVADQQPQQVELGGGEHERSPVEVRRPGAPIDLEPADHHPLVGVRHPAPQDGLDARD